MDGIRWSFLCLWGFGFALVMMVIGSHGMADPKNIALGRPAQQIGSDLYLTSGASRAVDGVLDGGPNNENCAQTDYQHPTSVWMVELEYHVYIDHIILHIGTSPVSDFKVFIHNEVVDLTRYNSRVQTSLCANVMTGDIISMNHSNPIKCEYGPVWGRFVYVYVEGPSLPLCEVEIYKESEFVFGSNLAIHKPVIFRYSYGSQSGMKAVDGDPRGDSHTSNPCVSYYHYFNQPAFLRIDLEHVYPISHVDIFPATYQPLGAFSILLMNKALDYLDSTLPEPYYHLCARNNADLSSFARFHCILPGYHSRYIYIQQVAIGSATVCEVRVYALPATYAVLVRNPNHTVCWSSEQFSQYKRNVTTELRDGNYSTCLGGTAGITDPYHIMIPISPNYPASFMVTLKGQHLECYPADGVRIIPFGTCTTTNQQCLGVYCAALVTNKENECSFRCTCHRPCPYIAIPMNTLSRSSNEAMICEVALI